MAISKEAIGWQFSKESHAWEFTKSAQAWVFSKDKSYIVQGPPVSLLFVSFPSTGIVGQSLSTFTVVAYTASGIADQFDGSCTLSINSGTGAIGGTTTQPFISGIATFNDITIDSAGAHTLLATSSNAITQVSSTITLSVSAAQEIYLPPYNSDYVVKWDVVNGTFLDLTLPIAFTSAGFRGPGFTHGNYVYFFPNKAGYILRIDINDGLAEAVYSGSYVDGTNHFIDSGLHASNNKVYAFGVGDQQGELHILDLSSGVVTIKYLSDPNYQCQCTPIEYNGKIYAQANSANTGCCEVDMADDSTQIYTGGYAQVAAQKRYGQYIYGVPTNTNLMHRYDTVTHTYSLVSGVTCTASVAYHSQGWIDGGQGAWYAWPYNEQYLVKFIPATETFSIVADIGGIGNGYFFGSGILASNGFIYVFPYTYVNSSINKGIKLNPTDDSWSDFGITEDSAAAFGCVPVEVSGKLYFPPFNNKTYKVLDLADDSITNARFDSAFVFKHASTDTPPIITTVGWTNLKADLLINHIETGPSDYQKTGGIFMEGYALEDVTIQTNSEIRMINPIRGSQSGMTQCVGFYNKGLTELQKFRNFDYAITQNTADDFNVWERNVNVYTALDIVRSGEALRLKKTGSACQYFHKSTLKYTSLNDYTGSIFGCCAGATNDTVIQVHRKL